jgi:hypothetical protein
MLSEVAVKLEICTAAGGVTVTTTEVTAGPSTPWQVSVYAVVAVGLTVAVPVGIVTVAEPVERTQLVALTTDHDRFVEAPVAIVVAVALKLAMRTALVPEPPPLDVPAAVTVTVAVAVTAPQVSVKVVSVVSAAVVAVPAPATLPIALSIWQLAAFWLAQASVVVAPLVTLLVPALKKVMLAAALPGGVIFGTVTHAGSSNSNHFCTAQDFAM